MSDTELHEAARAGKVSKIKQLVCRSPLETIVNGIQVVDMVMVVVSHAKASCLLILILTRTAVVVSQLR